MNHDPNCAFAVSFGDEPCDCEGLSAVPESTSSDVAKRYLAQARESLKRRPA